MQGIGWRLCIPSLLFAILATVLLGGCDRENGRARSKIVPKAIQTFTVSRQSQFIVRRFSGTVEPQQVATLSFKVSGRVESIEDKLGVKVVKGDLLASLQKTTFELNVRLAQASVKKAKARYQEAKTRYDSNKALYANRYVSLVEFRKAEADYGVADQDIRWAEANLNIALEDLARTDLKAPFPGAVAKTYVERYTEVKAGEPIIKLDGASGLEVTINIPDSLIGTISQNQKVKVEFVTLNNLVIDGVVTEVGATVNEANAYPVVVTLSQSPPQARSGMTVEVIFNIKHQAKGDYFLVPLNALIPGDKVGEAYVFIYDKNTSSVHKHKVFASSVYDNFALVREGLKKGDVLATSGVRFLTDGEKVSIYQDKSLK